MKLKLKRWFLGKLCEVRDALGRFIDEHDPCEVCGKVTADTNCAVGCGRRICYACDSRTYEDEVLCEICRSEFTPEEEADLKREAIANNCESSCHRPDCACTRVHAEHTADCETCKCFELDDPCDENCKPSGYTFGYEAVQQ